MSEGLSRLERAMELWLRHQAEGGDWTAIRAENGDLAELLDALQSGADAESASSEPGSGSRFGPFSILRELGRGGMGVVYEAEQRHLARRVALKVLHHEVVQSPASITRFLREAKTLAKLDHSGIVRVLDVGEHEGRHWLAMELIEGETLDALLRRQREDGGHRGDSLRRMVEIVVQAADALAHAHAQGIVHRDVKPSNIFVRTDGRAVLGDFGLARDASAPSLTVAGAVAGTPHYLAPEQVRGRTSGDELSDVFSLGATLYEALTLARPFDGRTIPEIVTAITTRDPIEPRRLTPGLPRDLAAIAMVALEKDRPRRYADARAMAADLHAFLELRPVLARPTGSITRLLRSVRREPWRAAVAIALASLLLFAVAFVILWPWIEQGRDREREERYQGHVARAAIARVALRDGDALVELEHAMELRPERLAPLFQYSAALQRQQGGERGLVEFERRAAAQTATDDHDWVRCLLLRRVGRDADATALRQRLGEARTVLALWIDGVMQLEGPSPSPAAIRAAYDSIRRAVNLSPAPEYQLWIQWAAVARVVDDQAIKREVTESVLGLWPEDGAALHYCAALAQSYDLQRAVELQTKAVELGFVDHNLLRNLASYEFRAGRTTQAVARMRELIARAPQNSEFRGLLAQMLGDLEDHAGGLAAVQDWLAVMPEDALAHRRLGAVHLARGENQAALVAFRRGAELAPESVDGQCDFALALDVTGDLRGAVAINRALLERHPTLLVAHQRLCGELLDLSEFEAAIAELERWAALHPDDPQPLLRLAAVRVHHRVGTPKEAIVAAERAVWATRGRDAVALRVLADAHELAGDLDGAARHRALADQVEAQAASTAEQGR
ncbi:MAG: protein kinase [Planctomycetes bacterium]|nr:protein kinase [Planctomycetota bacterium]